MLKILKSKKMVGTLIIIIIIIIIIYYVFHQLSW